MLGVGAGRLTSFLIMIGRRSAALSSLIYEFRIRHTAASWLVQDGVPLYDVQALLGHESFKTTERYANSQELHQPGEKLQVSSSQDRRNGVLLVLMPAP
jgi:integrase